MKYGRLVFMKQKIKKIGAVFVIIVLLPYIVTIFMNGKSMETNQNGKNGYIKVETKVGTKEISLEEYCIGTLAKEIPVDFDLESLKAQAVIVRTTIYKKIEEEGEKAVMKERFFTKSDMKNQWGRSAFQKNYKKMKQAWEETDGQVIMYNGQLAMVPFHQLSNGKTRVGKEVLGSDAYPYLQMKECPKDVEADGQMESRLIKVSGATVASQDSAGYVTGVKVGEETVTGETFRDTYGLLSSCFELQDFEGKTRVTTKGVGHGLGMSQNTANEMAKEGKKYNEILQYFYEGTELKEVVEILLNVE